MDTPLKRTRLLKLVTRIGQALNRNSLYVTIIDSRGLCTLVEAIGRRSNRISHSGHYPDPRGLLLFEDSNIAALRVNHSVLGRTRQEEWWLYDLTAACRAGVLYPTLICAQKLPGDAFVSNAKAFNNGLVLIEWRGGHGDKDYYLGAVSINNQCVFVDGPNKYGIENVRVLVEDKDLLSIAVDDLSLEIARLSGDLRTTKRL